MPAPFSWHVHDCGYDWAWMPPRTALEGLSGSRLLVLRPLDTKSPARPYHPLTPTAPVLRDFLRLADRVVAPDDQNLLTEIRSFANEFGQLGIDNVTNGQARGESLASWKMAIQELWTAYERWRALSLNPPRWWPMLARLSASARARRGLWVDANADRLTQNERQIIATALGHQIGRALTEHLQFQFVPHLKMTRFEMFYSPKNLLGAMWLYVARGLGQDESVAKYCRYCSARLDHVLPSGRRRRRDANFCDANCRASQYQKHSRNWRR